jgi:cytochrome c-type biogenesis protein CcmH/NrfG
MNTKQWIAVFVLFCIVACAVAAWASPAKRELVEIKGAVMAADYRGDLGQLASLRDRAAKLSADEQLGYLADYWTGFASWRIAINGASAQMPAAELKAHLEAATAAFERAARRKADFADAYAGAAGTLSWLAVFHREDRAALNRIMGQAKVAIAKALELEPANPRALWIKGAGFLYTPPERGGSYDRAIETYREMEKSSGAPDPASPFPDWGKPEALMSLAYAHLNHPKNRDAAAALEEARAALRLQPEWHYVKNILVPQIESARVTLRLP